MINQRILDSIGEIEQISNKLLKAKEKIKDEAFIKRVNGLLIYLPKKLKKREDKVYHILI